MANEKTAEEWQEVATNLRAENDKITEDIRAGTAKRDELNAQASALRLQARAATAAGDTATADSLKAQAEDLRTQANSVNSDVRQLEAQRVNNGTNIRIAVEKAKTAATTGPPDTSPNTPPATDKPNTEPTAVAPAATVQTTTDAGNVAPSSVATTTAPVDTTDPVANPQQPASDVDPTTGLSLAQRQDLAAANGLPAPEPVQGSIATDTTDPVGIGRQPASVVPANDGYGGASQAEADAINQAIATNKVADAQDAEDAAAGAAFAGAQKAKQQQAIANQQKNANNADWRVRISLAPNAQYLYKDTTNTLLSPLALTNGVVFPYTPKIDTSYHASYQPYDLTHSNYRGYFYKNSYADAVSISCTFTAQNTSEANYLLAVIHFFKSVTKMFYGQDQQNRGSPPPMVFITGLGEYQFSKHPCVVTEFKYNLPSDVDYIRAGSPNMDGSTSNLSGLKALTNNPFVSALIPPSIKRLGSSPLVNLVTGGAAGQLLGVTGVPKGAIQDTPSPPTIALNSPTYVPTKIDITLSLLPMQSRNQVSTQFNVKDFANGKLLKGGFW